jgi:hypothetical protein
MVCIACKTELQEKVYCPTCANKLYVAKADVPTYVPSGPVVQTVSGAWWLLVILPILFGGWNWIGGIIAWAVNKSKDPRKAGSMLTWGIVLSVIWLIIAAVIVVLFVTGILVMDTA